MEPTANRRIFVLIVSLGVVAIGAVACSIEAHAQTAGAIEVTETPKQRTLVLCGMDEVFEVDVRELGSESIKKRWSWRAKDHQEIPAAIRSQFGTTDECKPIAGNRYLVTSSGGGCALIEREGGRVSWYASVANAHSIELLPNDRVVVAASVSTHGNRLVVFDLGVSERPVFETPLVSAHGVVWDEAKGRLWAIGMDVLESYALVDWETKQPALKLMESYPLPDPGGHDLQAVPRGSDLVLSTHEHVYLFDRDTLQFRLHPELANEVDVKCLSIDAVSGQTVWLQGSGNAWWTSTLHFLDPQGRETLPNEKLYKARWVTAADEE